MLILLLFCACSSSELLRIKLGGGREVGLLVVSGRGVHLHSSNRASVDLGCWPKVKDEAAGNVLACCHLLSPVNDGRNVANGLPLARVVT